MSCVETAVRFGDLDALSGILTRPTVAPARAALVLVSAGLIPKFGPYRLYATLARRLAKDGITTLRFDLGSVGDSAIAQTALPLRARTTREIAAAFDHLFAHAPEATRAGAFVGGLCSGAEDAFRYAEQDTRVRGAILIDPFAYRTPGWTWRHFAFRAMRRSLRALGVYRPVAVRSLGSSDRFVTYKYMEHGESRRILRTLIARRAPTHFLYTGGARDVFNHPTQLAAMFPDVDFADCVTLDHLPHTDHTQVFEEDRVELIEAIARRLLRAPRRP